MKTMEEYYRDYMVDTVNQTREYLTRSYYELIPVANEYNIKPIVELLMTDKDASHEWVKATFTKQSSEVDKMYEIYLVEKGVISYNDANEKMNIARSAKIAEEEQQAIKEYWEMEDMYDDVDYDEDKEEVDYPEYEEVDYELEGFSEASDGDIYASQWDVEFEAMNRRLYGTNEVPEENEIMEDVKQTKLTKDELRESEWQKKITIDLINVIILREKASQDAINIITEQIRNAGSDKEASELVFDWLVELEAGNKRK